MKRLIFLMAAVAAFGTFSFFSLHVPATEIVTDDEAAILFGGQSCPGQQWWLCGENPEGEFGTGCTQDVDGIISCNEVYCAAGASQACGCSCGTIPAGPQAGSCGS